MSPDAGGRVEVEAEAGTHRSSLLIYFFFLQGTSKQGQLLRAEMGEGVLGDSLEGRKYRIVVQEKRMVSGLGKYTWTVRQCEEPIPRRPSQSHELEGDQPVSTDFSFLFGCMHSAQE